MNKNPSQKEINKFKLTLFILPVMPAIILYFKHHYTIALTIVEVCWAILLTMIFMAIIGKNIDKKVYKFIHLILKYLGIVISSIALFVTWVFAILPTGIFAKILKRDRLSLKKKETNSYWKNVEEKEPTYENQY